MRTWSWSPRCALGKIPGRPRAGDLCAIPMVHVPAPACSQDGIDNYTLCPRTLAEVESVMGGGKWPPEKDEAIWLRRRWARFDEASGVVVDVDVPPAAA